MRSKEVETAINNCKILIECLEKYKDTFYFTNEKAPLKASKGLDTLLAYIEELEKDVKDAMDGYQDLGKEVCFNFISKDKIRDKIKELNDYYKKEVYPTKYQWTDIDITEFYDSQIEILRELLGE